MLKKTILPAALLLIMSLSGGCTLDSREYQDMKALKEEYLVQIAELRQANETINRNITATYVELDALKIKLAEEEGKALPKP